MKQHLLAAAQAQKERKSESAQNNQKDEKNQNQKNQKKPEGIEGKTERKEEKEHELMDQQNTYAQAGVDIEKAEKFVHRIKHLARRPIHDKLWKGAGGYASVYPITDEQAVALTTDGVGTKLLLACERGKLSTIGIDLVAMCANDLICVGARPVAFLDYYATGKLDDNLADQVIEGIVEGCDRAGMILAGGETAEMPGLYSGNHFDMGGFAMGLVSKTRLITGQRIAAGHKIIGIASSGIHSNGLSLARKVLPKSEETSDRLLIPTHIYSKPVNALLDASSDTCTGIANITGGGWRNLLRLNSSVGYLINDPLPVPDIFAQLAEHVCQDEMYKTFNMGMGLAIIAPDAVSKNILNVFQNHSFTAKVVGEVTGDAGKVIVDQTSEGPGSKLVLKEK